MKGLLRFLQLVEENWATIVAIATLLFAICMKLKSTINKWITMSDGERQKEKQAQIQKAKQAIANYILSFVADAEIYWDGSGLGPIKRAQVIEKIYKEYPILLEVVDQDELMKFIDVQIDAALEVVREKLRKEAKGENVKENGMG